MEGSFNVVKEWRAARQRREISDNNKIKVGAQSMIKWKPPEVGMLKVNVDAATNGTGNSFSVGMVIRDHTGSLICRGKNNGMAISSCCF